MNRFAPAIDMNALWTVGYDPSLWPTRYRDPTIGQFISADDFEGSPSDPSHLHKYNYCANNPISATDPSGHDFSLSSLAVASGIGSLLGGISTFGVNYALGKPQTFSSIAYGALFGGIAGPLALAFPLIGVGLAGYGIYQGWNLAWQVWTNPRSTNGQLTASLVIFGASLFGGYAAGKNLASNGWYNPAFERPPVTSSPGLNSGTPLAETFEGVPDNSLVHISRASLSDLADGVKGSPGTGKSYWLRWGDIKHLTVEQYRNVVGGLAQGGTADANTFVFKLQNGATEGLFQAGGKALGTFQEYESSSVIVPDAGGVVGPR